MKPIFNFQGATLAFLFANMIIVAVMTSLVFFAIITQQQQQQVIQQKATQESNRIINEVFYKLDLLHNQSNQLVNAQGNITQQQRSALLKEFTDIENQGGLATKSAQVYNNHTLHEILGNVTQLTISLNLGRH